MKNKNFYDYVIDKYKGQDNPKGDFAYDIENDGKMPKNKDNKIIFNYLDSTRMCVDAFETYKKLKIEYKDYYKEV